MDLTIDIAPEVYPLAPFVGRWRGAGTVGYPGMEPSAIVQELVLAADDGPYLAYTASTWLADAEGTPGQKWHAESGFWRVVSGQSDPAWGPRLDPPFEVELLLADPAGYVSVYFGQVDGPRIDLASDVLARTADAAEVNAGRRLYGLVEGSLMWAWDIAAFGHPLQSYLAVRLEPWGGPDTIAASATRARPALRPDCGPASMAPVGGPSDGVVSAGPSAGVVPAGPSAGVVPVGPVTGAPSASPSAGVPSVGPSAGVVPAGPSAGVVSAGPSAGVVPAGPSAGVPSVGPVTGVLSASPSASPSAGVPSVGPSADAPPASVPPPPTNAPPGPGRVREG